MYKRASSSGAHIDAMPTQQFQWIVKSLKRQGVQVNMDDPDANELLRHFGAVASTPNGNIMNFLKSPSRATVFEELIHLRQWKTGENDGTPLRRAMSEVFAKEKLLKNAKAYKLTPTEVEETKELLAGDRKWLEMLDRR